MSPLVRAAGVGTIKGVVGGFLMGWGLQMLLGLAQPRLQVDLYPGICQAPCTLRVTTRVDPNEDNRQLTIEVAGEHYSSVSSELLDGSSPRTVVHPLYRDIPAGEYEVAVTLQTTGRTYAVVRSWTVAGRN